MDPVKTLLFLAITCVAVGLYFHDKQQTAKLNQATAVNADLTQQLASYQTAVYQLKQQLSMTQYSGSHVSPSVPGPAYQSPLNTGGLETHSLDESH